MKIAQVAPLYESCPPQLYGGTERVVSYLTEELVREGHDVVLFASGDSRTAAELVSPRPRAIRLDPGCKDPIPYELIQLRQLALRAPEFDIIHFHGDLLHFPLFAEDWARTLTTLHGRLDLPDLPPLLREFPMMPLASISQAQRTPVPWANWHGTVHHGLPAALHRCGSGRGGYLAFLGRISPEKRPDRAIEIARRAGLPLRMAAKVDDADRTYFEAQIRPLLGDPRVDFIGEIDEDQKSRFLGDALALLFPVDWPEPFGLVMIEAMANGTPVIAFRRGSVPEIVEHGLTGAIVDDMRQAVAMLPRVLDLDRSAIRRRFEERFCAERMAHDYLRIYAALLRRRRQRVVPAADIEREAAEA